jgi:hypothetical protein
VAALLAAINRSGTGVGNDNSANNSLLTSAGSFTLSVDGGHGLLTITDLSAETAGQETKKSVFTATELLMVDSGALPQAPHSGRTPISTLVGRGLTDLFQFDIPSLTPGNLLTAATLDRSASGVRIADTKALTFQGYEVTLLSVTSTRISPESNFFNDVGTFEIRNTGTNAIATKEMQLFGNFQSAPGPRQITGLNGSMQFDGLELRFELDAPAGQNLSFGQKFLVSPISNEPRARVDGNTGIPITVPTTVRDTQEQLDRQLNVLILPALGDKRVVADRILDTESSITFRSGVSQNSDVILSDFSSRTDGEACSFCDGGGPGTTTIDRNKPSFIDARVTARSSTDGAAVVNLSAGVVLTNSSKLTLSNQIIRRDFFRDSNSDRPNVFSETIRSLPPALSATSVYFQEQGIFPGFEGSVATIVAKSGEPAVVHIQDRVLAVLNGSGIQPERDDLRTSLLTVLDSQLVGPTKTPTSLVDGVETPNRGNNQIPPLLEIGALDEQGNPVGEPSTVTATSAVVVRSTGVGAGVLDGALLEASSPILTLANSRMAATGHLIDLAGRGPNGQPLLNVNLNQPGAIPSDALVKVDRGSMLAVHGNLLNLANGASANVNGYLFSIANGSTLDLKGTLFSLQGNSILRLNSDAFGIFVGEGPNTLNVTNNLCAGKTCGVLADSEGREFQFKNNPIRVSGVAGNVELPPEFVPFKSPGGAPPNLEILPEAALFHVEPGSELHINNVPVVPSVRPK